MKIKYFLIIDASVPLLIPSCKPKALILLRLVANQGNPQHINEPATQRQPAFQ